MAKELILVADVPGLGIEGDLVKVADGYARNYLLPRKLGTPVTALSRRQLELKEAVREERMRTELENAQRIVGQLETVRLVIPAKAGPEGKLFGSVSSADIAEALAAEKIDVDRHKVALGEPLRELGEYEVTLKLHPELQASVSVAVVEE